MIVEDLSNLKLVGCINEDGNTYDLYLKDEGSELYYANEAGYIVRIEVSEDIDIIPINKKLIEQLNETISNKLLEKGIVLSGFIYGQKGIYIINSDESTICFMSLPDYECDNNYIDFTFTDVEEED